MAATFAGATSLSIVSITPSSTKLDNGQSITITGTWAGGTAPYNAVWYTGPEGTTCPQEAANVLAIYNGLSTTSNSITVSPTTSNSYCLGITDSESPPVTQLSLNYTEKFITSGFNNPFGVSFSPSGTYAYVSNANSNNVVIINTASNTVVNSITSGFNALRGVAFSPSGTYAYVANEGNNNVVIINTATNTVTGAITPGLNSPQGMAFSPSGTYAYVTNCNSSCGKSVPDNVVIINTASNTVVNSITAGFNSPREVSISPSGTYAYVTNSGSNNVVIIDTASNTVVNSITSGFSTPVGVAFSPSGTYAYVTNCNSSCGKSVPDNVVIINTATNTVTGSITSGIFAAQGVAFSPSGAYAYITNFYSNNVVIINPGIGAETTNTISSFITVSPKLSATSITTFYPVVDSGHFITLNVTTPTTGTPPYKYQWYSGSSAICSSDSIVNGFTNQYESFSLTSNTYYCAEITDSAETPESVYTPTFKVDCWLQTVNPDLSNVSMVPSNPKIDLGQPIAFTTSWSGGTPPYSASLYSSTTSTCNQQSTLIQQDIEISSNSITFSAVSPTSNTYYCTYITDNDLNSYLVNEQSNSIKGYYGPSAVAFSPSGTYAYVTNAYASNVVIINTATNTVVNSITSGFNTPYGVSFSPSGTYAYVSNYNGNNVVIVNTASNTVVNSITLGFSDPQGVAFSPSGTYAYVTNSGSNNVVIVNTASNTVVNSITLGFSDPQEIAISPSGTYAYVTNCNSYCSINAPSNVVIINTATNTVVNTMVFDPYSTPQGVAIAPSGSYAYIAMCNTDCEANNPDNITIINTATNAVAGYIILPGFPNPYGVAFSPSGTYAYVANEGLNNLTIIDSGVPTANSINSEVTVNPSLGVPTLASSPSLPSSQGNGNTITFTATATGGTSPYTYNYLITNTVTGNLVANMLFTNVASTTNSFAWTIPGADIGNTVQANVIVTDSAYSPETTNSVESGTLTITYTPLSTPTLSSCPSSPILDAGQTVSCTITVSGGVAPYTYNWLISNSITDAITANMLFTGVSSTGNTFEYTVVGADAANSPLVFNVVVTDSHQTTINSIYSSAFTVNPALTIPSITPSNPTINSGQAVTFSSAWSGGTTDYTAKLYSSTTSTCNTGSTLVQTLSSLTSGSALFSSVSPTSTTYYCIFVTDSATTSYSLSASIPSGFSNPSEAAFSPSGAYAYITNFYSNNVMIINTSTNTVTGSITSGAFNNPTSAAFLASGAYAYVTNHGSNNVVIINTATNTVTGSITSGFDAPIRIAFSPSGTYAYVSNGNSANVVIINTATNTVTGAITPGFAIPEGIAFSPSGAYAYVANFHSSNVVIVNTATNTVTGSILYGFSNPRRIAFSPSGTYAYVTNYGSDNIVIINTATNTVTGAITPGLNSPQGMAFSPSGTYAYVTNTGSNNVIIINTEAATTNSINSEITVNTGPQISNPYSGGSTGYFGSNSTLTSSTTSTTSSSSTSTILPVTTITQIIASPGITKACNDTSGYTINYPSLNATIKIAPGIRGCLNVNVTNSTSQSKTLNKSVIRALNYTVNNTNVSTEAILHYPCSIPNSDVAPFILRNGTWQEITPFTLNVAACTVEFAVPSDPVIALLNTNATSTILTTAATTAVQTSVPVTSVPTNTGMILEILIILIIIIIAVALFLYFRRKS
ncbi:MAG: YncE family protein [Candidatus Marsarchaeota archaeon]|nr:YncE family protein [Candidatus Marsarchaeota archaeon]